MKILTKNSKRFKHSDVNRDLNIILLMVNLACIIIIAIASLLSGDPTVATIIIMIAEGIRVIISHYVGS